MALDYDSLRSKYAGFSNPRIYIECNGKDILKKNPDLVLTDIQIDLSAGFEASVASFAIYNCYDMSKGQYKVSDIQNSIGIGTPIKMATGYDNNLTVVFVGVITKVNFTFDSPEIPFIRVTAMDVRSIMMANCYSKQLLATYYNAAVEEIFSAPVYQKLIAKEVISQLSISMTPDNPASGAGALDMAATPPTPPALPPTIEMVAESDYEFIVKVAKKFNYDFFVIGSEVIFRPAKIDTDVLMQMAPQNILRDFDIEYDITGQVSEVEVRSTDTDKGKVISSKQSISNTWSNGNKASALVKGHKRIYLDSTVHDEKEAGYRVSSLVEDISYRYATLECTTVGLPELLPGKFVEIAGLGTGPNNTFYVTSVRHVLNKSGMYKCMITGKAASLPMDPSSAAMSALTGALPF